MGREKADAISPEVACFLGFGDNQAESTPCFVSGSPTAIAAAPSGGVTPSEIVSTARSIADAFSPEDPARKSLESFINAALSHDQEALFRLSLLTIEVYGLRINPAYRAAIWGGRTWREVQKERGRP